MRAARRAGETGQDAAATAEAIAKRDATDLANVDFMTPAPGVTVLDTTSLNFDESVAALVALTTAIQPTS